MIKLMTLMKASPSLDSQSFSTFWVDEFLPSILATPEGAKIVRVVHNHVVPLQIRENAGFSVGEWAGVGETWFESRADADAFLASPSVKAAVASHGDKLVETVDLLCTELPIWDDGLEKPSVKMIAFFHPSAEMNRTQSQRYWTDVHVGVGSRLNDPKPYAPRYRQNHVLADFHTAKPEYDFVGAPELWFKSEDTARRMFVEAKNMDLLAEDEAKFSDRGRTLAFVTDEQEVFVRNAAMEKA